MVTIHKVVWSDCSSLTAYPAAALRRVPRRYGLDRPSAAIGMYDAFVDLRHRNKYVSTKYSTNQSHPVLPYYKVQGKVAEALEYKVILYLTTLQIKRSYPDGSDYSVMVENARSSW